MRRLLPLTLLLAGCFGHDVVLTIPPEAFETPPLDPEYTACGAPGLHDLIGQPLAALPAQGPWQSLRVLHPNEAATMDFSEMRLTVTVDAQDRIETLRCQ